MVRSERSIPEAESSKLELSVTVGPVTSRTTSSWLLAWDGLLSSSTPAPSGKLMVRLPSGPVMETLNAVLLWASKEPATIVAPPPSTKSASSTPVRAREAVART